MGDSDIDWDRFVADHAERVLRIALRIVGHPADAEDVSQEVFAECLRIDAEGGMRDPTGMVVRLATVRSLDRLRRLRARPETGMDVRAEDSVTVVGPPEEAEAAELADWLRAAVARLPQRQAEVLALVTFEQVSRDDVARMLGISVEAVSTALFKARRDLAAGLDRLEKGRVR